MPITGLKWGRSSTKRQANEAFEREALASLDGLYRTARRLTRSQADAEDLVQDTYLKAFRAIDRFEAGTNLRAWLFTILHNTHRNRIRDRLREPVIGVELSDLPEDVSMGGGTDASPEDQLLKGVMAPEVQAAVDALPASFRQAVWLRDVEEFTYAEIAAMLEVPVGTVMSRISRGRRLLFGHLQHLRPVNA
jgi:RNA polymerase sigma-70 factor (ECF subfamily)